MFSVGLSLMKYFWKESRKNITLFIFGNVILSFFLWWKIEKKIHKFWFLNSFSTFQKIVKNRIFKENHVLRKNQKHSTAVTLMGILYIFYQRVDFTLFLKIFIKNHIIFFVVKFWTCYNRDTFCSLNYNPFIF